MSEIPVDIPSSLTNAFAILPDLRVDKVFASNSRGMALRLTSSDGKMYLLKTRPATHADSELGVAVQRHRLLWEARILAECEDAVGKRQFWCGKDSDQEWLLLEWLEGDEAGKVAKRVREEAERDYQKEFVQLATELASALARFHKAGYLHGDIQPPHFIRDSKQNWHLIDFELSHRPGASDVHHMGGLVHYNAPEIAKQMLAGGEVEYTLEAEVYAFCAMLYYLFLGVPPVDYGSDDLRSVPIREKLIAIAEGRILPISGTGFAVNVDLQRTLLKGLSLDPAERFHSIEDLMRDIANKKL